MALARAARLSLLLLTFPACATLAPRSDEVTLPLDLDALDERTLLRAHGHARLAPVAGEDGVHPEREPLLLVHGLGGHPRELQSLVDRFHDRFQIYVLAYDSLNRRTSLSGDELADEIATLAARLGPGRDVTLFAHSMGGIVARRALNRLYLGQGRRLEHLGRVRLVACDSPWQGYPGPSDRGQGRLMMGLARPWLPDALVDMRARSSLFTGDPASADPVERAGLLDVALPESVEIELVFALDGERTTPYSEGALRALPGKLAAHYARGVPMRGEAPMVNYWKSIIGSQQFYAFDVEMTAHADAGHLDGARAASVLARHFPKFAGDHMTVLSARRDGNGLLAHLERRFASTR